MSDARFGLVSVEDDERRASRWLLIFTTLVLVSAFAWAAYFEQIGRAHV